VTHKIGVVVVNHRSTGTRPSVALAGSIVRSDLRLTNPPQWTRDPAATHATGYVKGFSKRRPS
jgi:hypothetical protein